MSAISNCIFCGRDLFKEEIFSEEHIIPESLGGKIVIKCVCKECNNNLGRHVDTILCNSSYIKNVKRSLIPNQAERIKEIIKHNRFEDENKKQTHVFFNKNDPEMPEYYIGNAPDIELIKDDSSVVIDVIVRDGMSKASVRTAIERRAKEEGAIVKSEWLDNFIENRVHISLEPAEIHTKQMLDNGYQECVIKMSYEFARILLGPEYDTDEFGKEYHSFLCERIKGNKRRVHHHVIEATVDNPLQWIDSNKAVFFNSEKDQLWIRIILYNALVIENIVTINRSRYNIDPKCYINLGDAIADWKQINGA